MVELKRDTQLADVLELAPEVIPLFNEIGMHCLFCAMADEESIEQACMAHDVDVDAFLAKANEIVADFQGD
jgi:hybrid cluster-associated redox disulfide protein